MFSLGVPFATPRTRRASPVIEWFSCFPAVQLCHGLGAGSGGEKMVGRFLAAARLAGANRRCTSGSPFKLVKLARSHRLTPVDGDIQECPYSSDT
jgi:hypothetical protein